MKKSAQVVTFLIVTPSYNQGEFVKNTVDSVLTQTGVVVEYFVADGGSTDTTKAVLQKASKKYKSKQFEWVSEPDKGQTDAINKGIAFFSQREYDPDTTIFAYINSDDYYLPKAFSLVAKAFKKHPKKQWVVGEYQINTKKSPVFHTVFVWSWKWLLKRFYSLPLLFVANPIAQPSTFIRWSAVQKVGLFDSSLSYVMDYQYWLRLQKEFGNPVFIAKVLSSFRIHGSSKGGSLFKKQFSEQLSVARAFTTNPVLLWLHQAHNWLTTLAYSQTK